MCNGYKNKDYERHWYRSLCNFSEVESHPNILVTWLAGEAAKVVDKLDDDEVTRLQTLGDIHKLVFLKGWRDGRAWVGGLARDLTNFCVVSLSSMTPVKTLRGFPTHGLVREKRGLSHSRQHLALRGIPIPG